MKGEDGKNGSVLLLDDEPAVLRLISGALSGAGLEVWACQEIEAAWALLDSHRFDAVVTDLQVSELGGLEGIRLIRHVRVNYPEAAVLAVSGLVSDEVRTFTSALGCRLFQKPVDLDELCKALCLKDLPARAASGTVRDVELLDNLLLTGGVRSVLQPIVDLSGHDAPFRVHAVEGLARGPQGTPLQNPELLFGYAAHKERLFETDILCIRTALAEGRLLGRSCRLFINVQPRSLSNPAFVEKACALVEEAGLLRTDIMFELTEQKTILNSVAFAATLRTLRREGFGVSLDDYGVGFSNLHLVQDLHPDCLKISGYFCRGVGTDPHKREILRATAEMARRLSIPTVIENVETREEFEAVRSLGLTYGQGYYFARPAPAETLCRDSRLRLKDA